MSLSDFAQIPNCITLDLKRNLKSLIQVGVDVRVLIRVRFGSIRVLGFRGQRFQPHTDISKFRFGSDLCGFGSGLDNPLKLFLKF